MQKDLLEKPRYDFLDLLKTLAIFLVVFYHFNNLPTDVFNNKSVFDYFNLWFKSFAAVCVPLFFVVNGALLMPRNVDIKRHTFKILKIVLLTFVWGALSLFVLQYVKNYYFTIPSFGKALWTWKLGWINHLWFMQALVVVYVFAPLVVVAFQYSKNIFYFFLIILGLITFGNTLILFIYNVLASICDVPMLSRTFNFFNGFHAVRGIYGYTLVYFMLGGVLFTHRNYLIEKFKPFVLWCIIPFCMLILTVHAVLVSKPSKLIDIVFCNYDSVFTLLMIVALFILVLSYTHKSWYGVVIKIIANNSLGIYLIHRILGLWLKPYFITLNVSSLFAVNLLFTLLLLFSSLFLCLLLRRIPFVKYLLEV